MKLDIITPYDSEVKVYKIKFKNLTNLSVGGGTIESAMSPIDLPIAKREAVISHTGNILLLPYIPSSTLKGVLRSKYEEYNFEQGGNSLISFRELLRILKDVTDLKFNDKLEIKEKIIDPLLQDFLESSLYDVNIESLEVTGRDGISGLIDSVLDGVRMPTNWSSCISYVDGLKCEFPMPRYKLSILKSLAVEKYPCKVCKYFGASGYEGRIIVFDALPVSKYLINSSTHNAINRFTGAAANKKLYDIEHLEPGTTFLTFIVVETKNKDDEFIDWLSNKLKNSYLIMGKRSTIGYGEVTIESVEEVNEEVNAEQELENSALLTNLHNDLVEAVNKFLRGRSNGQGSDRAQ
ncbi:hypothetical protein GWK48_10405 [Metallosphaera tengchongensis]|uniref:CRISPR type III-associated protein domain-containing protein n=1 Tax=Metallosphaera tengchongensis TaxID=1532350 RepID=A0A6N0NV65_9CREN|nr:RAMP superfamily CRISPR-associated protein [Metallosphaera tengchongensis]QKR00744.1 hypothetical protein GWK48_10405 [Metallosphaera tengchongensis]